MTRTSHGDAGILTLICKANCRTIAITLIDSKTGEEKAHTLCAVKITRKGVQRMTDLRHRVTAEETEQTIAELEMRLSTATGEKAEKIREYIAIERQVLQSIKDGAIITVVQRIPEKVITSDE